MKNKWKYLCYRTLKAELKKYGYQLTLKKTVLMYGITILFVAVFSYFYKLNWPFMLFVDGIAILLMPSLMILSVKEKYHAYMFSLANDYMEQFLHTFKRTGTILQTLMEIYEILNASVLQDVILKSIRHIVDATDGLDSEQEGLDMIGDFFHCDKVDMVHRFVLGAQRRGGDVSESIRLLENNRLMWVKRTENIQKEFQVVKRDVRISLVATLLICLSPLYLLGNQFDISAMLLCQITAAALVIFCILLYLKANGKLCRSWMETSKNLPGIQQKYLQVEAYDESKELRKSIAMSFVALVLMVGLFIRIRKMWVPAVGAVLLIFLMNQHKIGHQLAKKTVNREIVKCFPEWLMQMALLLQTNNVQMSLRLSLEDAPKVLVPAIQYLVADLEEHPNEVAPYHRFLKSYPNPGIRSAMQNLYALSNGNITDIEAQIQELIDKNHLMINKTEQLHQEDMLAGMRVYVLGSTLLASLKLMTDMALLLVVFLQNLKF